MNESDVTPLARLFGSRIDELLANNELSAQVADYFDLDANYAAATFEFGENPHFDLVSDDFLAVSFLDVPIRASAYRRIQALKPRLVGLLEEIDPELEIWHMKHEDHTYLAASKMWTVLLSIPSLGPTRVSKLMARKRPKLIPIWDSRVHDFFQRPYWTWTPLSLALADVERQKKLAVVRTECNAPPTTSLLRILDVTIWTQGNGSVDESAEVPDDVRL